MPLSKSLAILPARPSIGTALAVLLTVLLSCRTAMAASPLLDAAFRSFPAGSAPTSVAVGDVDEDGRLDLAISSQNGGITVLHGQGDGTFTAWKSLASYDASSVVLADLNQDHHLDLVVCGFYSPDVAVSLGHGDGRFGSTRHYATGTTPRGVEVADVNRDGIPDLILCNSDSFTGCSISVFLGVGDGTFGPRHDSFIFQGANPTSLAIGDLNGDGIPDLAVAVPGGTFAYIMTGHGDGTFANAGEFATWDFAASVALANVNGDGNLDLIASGSPASLLLGKGDGTFGDRMQLGPGGSPLVLGDFNKDEKIDVAFTGGSLFDVILGKGNGSFSPTSTYDTGFESEAVAVGDFNGDGIPDLVTTSHYAGTFSIQIGNGDGSFGKGEKYPVGNFPKSTASGDFDGDGVPDLAVANSGYSTDDVSLFRGHGDGSFVPAPAPAAGPSEIVIAGDLNHDGKDDLVVARNGVSVLLATGNMSFGPATSYEDTITFQSVAIGDLNGDGIPDIAATRPYRFNSNVRNPDWIPLTAVYVLFGHGDGTFGGDTVYTAGSGTIDLAIADVDRNGHNDLLVANATSSTVSVFLADGAGRLQEAVSYPTLPSPSGLVVADLDGDGTADIGTLSSNAIGLLRGLGNGQFGAPEQIGSVPSATALAAADLDLDGHVDLVVSADYTNGVTILRGLGGGSFAGGELYGTGEGPAHVAIRDFNGDGRPDIAVPNTNARTVSILRNRAADVSVPALVWLEDVKATPSEVEISWQSETIAAAQTRVERSANGTSWTVLGQPTQNGTDRLTFDDRSVSEGASYKYRLVVNGSTVVSVTSVHVPVVQALQLSVSPNPVRSDAHLAFHLASAEKGLLEIWSVAGRRVWSKEVGTLGAGEHTIEFPGASTLVSGSYFLRLTQGSRSAVQRFTVLR